MLSPFFCSAMVKRALIVRGLPCLLLGDQNRAITSVILRRVFCMALLIEPGCIGRDAFLEFLRSLPVGKTNLDLDPSEIIPASCHFSISNPLLARVHLRWKTRTANHYNYIIHDAILQLESQVYILYIVVGFEGGYYIGELLEISAG
jgi:hypothetical protein